MGNGWTGATTAIMHDVWTDGMDDAWTGAMTDVMDDVWTVGMDNAQMGAMTDVTHSVWTDGTDNALMGPMTDIMYDVQTDVDITRTSWWYFTTCFSQCLPGNSDGFSADSDKVTDRLLDQLTDKFIDVQTKRVFQGFHVSGNFIQEYS